MTSIYTQETMLVHTTFYVTNRSAECGLKIKLFNPQHPLEHQELELSDHRLKYDGCLIGNSPNCGLMLPSVKVQEIHGKLFIDKGKYYFQDLTEKGITQYNDQTVKKNKTYLLETDDIIRIGEFV